MKVKLTFPLSKKERKAIAYQIGKDKRASRSEAKRVIAASIHALLQDMRKEYSAK
jgi:hypothetical protein